MIVIPIAFLTFIAIYALASSTKNRKEDAAAAPPPSIRGLVERIAGHEVCNEKINALSLKSKNTLITSRAGGGKTMIIALKMALEVNAGVESDRLLALSFNKNAASGLGERLKKYGAKNVPSATFHSLAYQIVRPKQGSLVEGVAQRDILRELLGSSINEDGLDSILSFISSAKHKGLDPDTLLKRAKSIGTGAQMAVNAYAGYIEHLRLHGLIDFDDLIELATLKLKNTDTLPTIRLKDKTCNLNSLKLICIDEFQDFSRPFYELIKALKDKNSSMGLYCVGDDWQAINGFAGSDLAYFHNFDAYFGNSAKANLLTNFRSGKEIVEYANSQMKGLGSGGIASHGGGKVELAKVDVTQGNIYVRDGIKRVINSLGGSPLVLSRRNELYGQDLTMWQEEMPKAKFLTIHRAKGMESNTVILVRENRISQANSQLDALLNIKPDDVEQEERRIAYVAFTRARHRLVIIN
ncbi:MAG: DEAD/DEAH box helicase [Patescibacteria group bacterium]|nr:DEAD/DEAH box helicase [Patescibacteria group bacterium]